MKKETADKRYYTFPHQQPTKKYWYNMNFSDQ